jgi:hypothetical protein
MTAPTPSIRPQLPDPRTAAVTGAGGPSGIDRVAARLLTDGGKINGATIQDAGRRMHRADGQPLGIRALATDRTSTRARRPQ